MFLELGYTSLFNYCIQALQLSESVASNFVPHSEEEPERFRTNCGRSFLFSKARKIAPVLTLPRRVGEKAKVLPTRKLKEEGEVPESRRENYCRTDEVRLAEGSARNANWNFGKTLQEKVKRVQDFFGEAQRTGREQ